MTCMNPRGRGALRAFAHPTRSALAVVVVATIAAHVAALAQGLDVKRYNPSEWTKGRFDLREWQREGVAFMVLDVETGADVRRVLLA